MKINCLYDKLVNIDELKKHPKNRNTHPQDQIERLAKILAYQGWRYPIKISKQSGYITSGHGRLLAAKLNGWSDVPVNFQGYDNEDQEYADVQADNAISSWAFLDYAEINKDLENLDGHNFDIDLLGIKNFLLEPAEKFEEQEHWSEELPDMDKAQEAWKIVITSFDGPIIEKVLQQLDKNNITDVRNLNNGKLVSIRWQ